MSFLLNAVIFSVTLVLVLRLFRRDGRWSLHHALHAMRYFTVQSNLFCAVAALCMCLAPEAAWAWWLKYVGTAAVSVTMLTVLLFLGPSMGSYKPLLSGGDLFMHLLTPVMAIVSFCVFERRELASPAALAGMLPVVAYGIYYAYKLFAAPEGRRWEDFYGFNKGGHWRISMCAMFLGAFLVCLFFTAVQGA